MAKFKKGKGAKGARKPKDDRTDLIEKIDMSNERLFAYYKAQNIVPEEEWDVFVDALRQHLPTTFRVAGSRQVANSLNSIIKDTHVPSLSNVTFEGQRIPPPVQIPWYPDGLAWHFNVPKKVLRRSPEFKKFHSFLVFETEVGNISRQEAVSMLPPLLLEVEPHHLAMDMCAAPGSKTAQILEALHAQDTATSTSIPSGLLLANDSDNKRTHLLIHQSARLPSPALMVTNLDASNYPSIKIKTPTRAGGSRTVPLLFDRILCDVPCSGDGTIRKNMGIWKSWQPMDGNGLHGLQVRILLRAMNLLKDNGRIVYSTCSLNPVENEAVIAEALAANPAFELVDVSSKLPELKRRPGLSTWHPSADRVSATTYATYEEFMNSSTDSTIKAKMTPGHWPPPNAESLHLDRTMRIYPHLQDTGGFYVAVLQKTQKATGQSERKREADDAEEEPESKRLKTDEDPQIEDEALPAPMDVPQDEVKEDEVEEPSVAEEVDMLPESIESETTTPAPEVQTEVNPEINQNRRKKKSQDGGGFKENPYTFLKPDDPILLNCIERLHINSDFPSSNVLVRNPEGDAARSLYLANDIVKNVIVNNNYERIRLTAAGTKVFAKQEAGKGGEAQFRVLGEGLPVILPYVDPATIIKGDMVSLKTLVESYYPLCSNFVDEFREAVEARPTGSHIVRFPLGQHDGTNLTHDLMLPIWKSNVSLTLMIDKKAKSALSLRLFGADITTAGKEGRTNVTQKAGPDESVATAEESEEL
ncbi:Multisite-specific tRNA:(cytosine-C(5))-methyltransferase trm4b [Psilocybe cubensis]|uniref:Multisite-specific tRNA:(Cytosine-C(5))-methyltransferase trm4b n=2 Tax=Psilocybe cubensis TaxID=181762 RepID=A0ACB8GRR4_PSICU|nr:Multisite-specific tRNA:(cytosine-C(5))-methyltransferase trm4b [Psilocybe cubensis]KAH9477926.1 Multisite-specific tRNA:(cytosine-C(5))-methyltransferase trm4b [Psilocybe cubensis]